MKKILKFGFVLKILLMLLILSSLVIAPPDRSGNERNEDSSSLPPWVVERRADIANEENRLNALPRNIEVTIEQIIHESDKSTYFYRVDVYNTTIYSELSRMVTLNDMWVDRNSSTDAFIEARIYDEAEAKARNYNFPVLSRGGNLQGRTNNRGRIN